MKILPPIQRIFKAVSICLIFLTLNNALNAQISDSIDVVHYTITIDSIGFSQKYLRAEAELLITPAENAGPLQGITLELLGLHVDSVYYGLQKIPSFVQADTLLRFDISPPIALYDTQSITVFYSGTPHVEPYNWGGFHFQGSAYAYNLGIAIEDLPHNYGKVMFPCVDDFVDRATYAFIIRTPANMTGVANGYLNATTQLPDGRIQWHWKLDQSIPTYLACVAVSDYTVISDTFQSVNGPIPTTIHVRPDDSLKAVNSFVNLVPVCEVFEQHFGPYVWPRVGYVIAPKGAMEHASCITYPRNTVDGSLNYEYLYAHELAHMWFGDLVTCENAGEMWLNEGWASFAEFIYKEGLYGKDAMKDYVRKTLKGILQNAHIEEGGYRPLYGMPVQYTYGTTIYDKGACVAHTLRAYLGDSLFFPAVQKYLEDFAFQEASTQDMINSMEQESGVNLQDFFDAWVYSPGFPHFRIDSMRVFVPTGPPPIYSVDVYLSQQGKGTTSLANSNRIGILFMNNQGERFSTVVEFSGAQGVVNVQLPFYPDEAFIDPEEKICDATTDVFKTIKTTGKIIFADTWFEAEIASVQDSALLRATHHWVAPEPMNPPLPGFRISDYRYWSVNGIWDAGLQGNLRFFFTKFSNLDNGIIFNAADSIVLLHRKGPGYPWSFFPATMEGQTYQGYMVTDTILHGDFAIGVYDHEYLGTMQGSSDTESCRVYPNPSSDTFKIKCGYPEVSALRIFSGEGKEVFFQDVKQDSAIILWDAQSLPVGNYFLVFENAKGKAIGSTKLVKQ